MDFGKEARIYKTFLFSISLTVALCFSATFLGMSIRTNDLIRDEMLTRARADIESIIITRQWNASYGAVLVEKKEGVESNPYLKDPDVVATDGKVYTKRNPALMTREISELSRKQGALSFRITSLNPLNPQNAPDEFERAALHLFERGEREHFRTEINDGRTSFRYMAPVLVRAECLQCHAEQGYKEGDVRGGISVSFDMEDFRGKMKKNTYLIVFFGFTTTFLTLSLVWLYTSRLVRRIAEARKKIEEMAITDELTGLYNRRHVFSRFEEELGRARRLGKGLGCVIFDLDHFKAVNDRYGHQAGDELLRATAAAARISLRAYDILGRYGGEEFLVILMEASREEAFAFAERIRQRIRDEVRVPWPAGEIRITASFGIGIARESDASVDDIIARADLSLYKAKSLGRDRVCCQEEEAEA